MTDHVRTQIRDYAVGLTDALTSTSTRCYGARPKTRPLHTLPAWIVYTNAEGVDISSGTRGSRRLERTPDLVFEGYAAATGDVDKTLDTMSAEVEAALAADPAFGGLLKDLSLRSVEKEQDDEAEKPTWLIRMTWYCEYHTRETAPTAALT